MTRAFRSLPLFLCLVGCSLTFGQMGTYNYNGASAYSVVPQNFAACGSINCWHANLNQTGIGSQIFASNGRTFVINSAHQNYQLTDYPNYAWVGHPEWGTVYGLQSDGAGNIYALQGAACGATGDIVAKWNGSSWVNQSGCFNQFWIGGNGTMLAIDLNGALWVGPPSAPSQYGLPESGHWVISASWIDDGPGTFMAVTNDNQIWSYVPGTGWVQPPGGGCCATSISADGGGTVYVVGTDGNVYHYNGSGYDKIPMSGSVSTGYGGLANGGAMRVWAVGPTVNNNNLYRFSEYAIRHTRTLSGGASCGGCTHTLTTTASWQSNIRKGDGGAKFVGNPNGEHVLASTNDLLDPFLCVEQDSDCTATFSGETATCSIAGPLVVASAAALGVLIGIEFGETTQSVEQGPNGPPYKDPNSPLGLVWYQNYNGADYCSAATTPPDLMARDYSPIKELSNAPAPSGWEVFAPFCFTFSPPGNRIGNWICPKSWALESYYGIITLNPNFPCSQHNN